MMIYRSALVSVFSSWQCCEKTFLVVWNRIADSQEDGSHDGSIVHKFLLGSKFLSLGIHILLHACYFFLLCLQHPFSLIKLFLSPFLQMGRERQKKSMFLTPFLSLNCQMVINWNIRWELNLTMSLQIREERKKPSLDAPIAWDSLNCRSSSSRLRRLVMSASTLWRCS